MTKTLLISFCFFIILKQNKVGGFFHSIGTAATTTSGCLGRPIVSYCRTFAGIGPHTTPPTTTTTTPPTTSTQLLSSTKPYNDRISDFDRYQARKFTLEGMESFRKGRIVESIEWFDQVEQISTEYTPFLWQRGISYYYTNDFQKASQQFRTDVQVNPLDVEEIVWDIASQLRSNAVSTGTTSITFPLTNQLSLPKGKQDRRPIMNTVYKLFRGEATELDLAMIGHSKSASPKDEFYALFYLGLYCEARGEDSKACQYMKQAANSKYATSFGQSDYMTSCARVHCNLRGWQ